MYLELKKASGDRQEIERVVYLEEYEVAEMIEQYLIKEGYVPTNGILESVAIQED